MSHYDCLVFVVTVPLYKKVAGTRQYSKADYCLYCKQALKSKVSRHYLAVHANKASVEDIIGTDDCAKRKVLLYRLQQLGNFEHNTKVLTASLFFQTSEFCINSLAVISFLNIKGITSHSYAEHGHAF